MSQAREPPAPLRTSHTTTIAFSTRLHPQLLSIAALVLTVVVAFLALRRAPRIARLGVAVFAANVLGHLLLDTIEGGIRLLWPASDAELVLVPVEARYHPWYLNFLLHWTFALELALVGAAWWVWRRRSLAATNPSSTEVPS